MSWLPKRCVVVPVDFSEFSWEALRTAAQLVDSPSALQLIHVLPNLSPMEPGVIWGTVDDHGRAVHAEQALRDRLPDAGLKAAAIHIRFGEPAHEIAEAAQALKADLIVISSHGRTGAAHLLIGSVAERVVRLARCPVLVLRR